MKLFYRVQQVNGILWVKMYSDCKWPWFAARRPIKNRKEAITAFNQFVEELRNEV